jgi:hypothetical protein
VGIVKEQPAKFHRRAAEFAEKDAETFFCFSAFVSSFSAARR